MLCLKTITFDLFNYFDRSVFADFDNQILHNFEIRNLEFLTSKKFNIIF